MKHKEIGKTNHKIPGQNQPERKRRFLTKQVDNAFIISSEEPDGVFEEKHEGGIDDSISQLVGIDLRESNRSSFTATPRFVDVEKRKLGTMCLRTGGFLAHELQRGGAFHLKLTLKSRSASIWF